MDAAAIPLSRLTRPLRQLLACRAVAARRFTVDAVPEVSVDVPGTASGYLPSLMAALASAGEPGETDTELADGTHLVCVSDGHAALAAVLPADDSCPAGSARAILSSVLHLAASGHSRNLPAGASAGRPGGPEGSLTATQLSSAAGPVLSFAAEAGLPVTVAVVELRPTRSGADADCLTSTAVRIVRSLCREQDLVGHLHSSRFAVLFSRPVPAAAVRARCAAAASDLTPDCCNDASAQVWVGTSVATATSADFTTLLDEAGAHMIAVG